MSVLNFTHDHEGPLDQVTRHFSQFKVETPKTIQAGQVYVEHEVAFKKDCRDEALETLRIHNIFQDLKDGDMEYLMLQDKVDGPITDGNRIERVNDCEIRTYVSMRPVVEGKVTSPAVANKQKMSSVVSAAPVKASPKMESGCYSNGASSAMLLTILVTLLMRKNSPTKI